MLHIDYTHIVTQGKQIFIVYVGGRANAVKYGSTLNSVFSVGYFFLFFEVENDRNWTKIETISVATGPYSGRTCQSYGTYQRVYFPVGK